MKLITGKRKRWYRTWCRMNQVHATTAERKGKLWNR